MRKFTFCLFVLLLNFISYNLKAQFSQTTTADFNGNTNFNVSTQNNELKLTPDLGTGADGNLYIAPGGTAKSDSVKTYVIGSNSSGQNSIQVNSTNGFHVGDEILIITMSDNNTVITNNLVGQYEFRRIQAIITSALITDAPLVHNYNTSTQIHQVLKVPNYLNATIDYGATLTCDNWDITNKIGGIVCFRVKGVLVVNTLAKIDASEKGYVGPNFGSASQGESICGNGVAAYQNNVNAGGGGGFAALGVSSAAAGGGGGSYGTSGTAGCNNYDMYGDLAPGGYAGITVGSIFLSNIMMGGSGGAGNQANSGTGGKGGNGAGIIYFSCDSISLLGNILCDGANGSDATSGSGSSGAGGGGAGGSIFIISSSIVNCGNLFIKALGGQGGSYAVCGGNGGNGIIRIDAPSVTGTANPTVSYTGTSYALSGTSTTPPLIKQTNKFWGVLTYNDNTSAPGTSVKVYVLSTSNSILQSNVSSGSNLSVTNDTIKLKITLLNTFGNQTPIFYDWNLTVTTGIEEIIQDCTFNIYPNPCKEKFILEFDLKKPSVISIKVIDILGKVVYDIEPQKYSRKYNRFIDINNLSNGIYNVIVKINEKTITKKISIVK